MTDSVVENKQKLDVNAVSIFLSYRPREPEITLDTRTLTEVVH